MCQRIATLETYSQVNGFIGVLCQPCYDSCYRTPLSARENDSLSNFCKGLSSAQPDLLKASDLTVTTPINTGVDIDVPPSPQTTNTLGRWNGSMSGLHLLSKQDQSSKLEASLSTASIHQRLQESKSRMNELANRISVISRSNTNLLDLDSVSPTHVPKLRPLTPCKQPKTVLPKYWRNPALSL